MIPSFQARAQTLFRNPWWSRFLSWLVGGFCGALLCLGSPALLLFVPALVPLIFVLPPLGLIYGFVWGWLLVRRTARRSGILLNDHALEHAAPWQWHLGLLFGIPLCWLFVLVALTVSVPSGEVTSSTPIPPPPTPDAARAGEAEPFLAATLSTLTVFSALVGRSTVALWAFAVLRRIVPGPRPIQKGV